MKLSVLRVRQQRSEMRFSACNSLQLVADKLEVRSKNGKTGGLADRAAEEEDKGG